MNNKNERPCEICGINPVVEVFSSSVAAMSLGFCRECIAQGAEPFGMFVFIKWLLADGKKELLHPSAFEIVTFHEGQYKTLEQVWDDIPQPPDPLPVPEEPFEDDPDPF